MKVRSRVFDFLVLFLLIFSFYIIGSLQSSFLCGGISFLILCTSTSKIKCFVSLLNSETGKILQLGYLFILALNLVYSIINCTFDVSYFSSLVMQAIKIFCVLMTLAVLDTNYKGIEYYEKLIVFITFAQSIIQFVAFSNKGFANIILHFNHAYDLYEDYGGRRGLALSGGAGWPLAIVYGISFLFYTKNFLIEKEKIALFDVVIGLVLLLGVLFSGRSAYLGIISSVLYFIVCRKKTIFKLKIIFKFFVLLVISGVLVLGCMYLFAKNMMDTFMNYVLPWAFEFFYNKASSNSMHTGSTDRLLEMWGEIVYVTERTLLLGDGFFTDPVSGAYFHHIDIGYLRNIFYWGLVGTSIFYTFFISLFVPKISHSQKNERIFIFILILTMFILELKAMTIFSAHLSSTLIIFWLFMSEKLRIQNSDRGKLCVEFQS